MTGITREYGFSAIYVVQFLGAADEPTGTTLFNEVIQPLAKSASIDTAFADVQTREELIAALTALHSECLSRQHRPILHVETHGGPLGISSYESEGITWQQLKPMLGRLNHAPEGNLFVVMAACHGLHLIRTLLPTDRTPVWGFLGPDHQVMPSDVANGFRAFYTSILQHFDLNLAIDDLRRADSSNPETWKLQNAEIFFAFMFGEYMRLQGSSEALKGREDDIVATLTLRRKLPTERMLAIRREVRARLRDHAFDFERLKRHFLMLDLFPSTADRYPITYDEAIALHARVRALADTAA